MHVFCKFAEGTELLVTLRVTTNHVAEAGGGGGSCRECGTSFPKKYLHEQTQLQSPGPCLSLLCMPMSCSEEEKFDLSPESDIVELLAAKGSCTASMSGQYVSDSTLKSCLESEPWKSEALGTSGNNMVFV